MDSNILNASPDVLLYALTMIAALGILFTQLDESVTVSRRKADNSNNLNALEPAAEPTMLEPVSRPS